MEKSLGVPTSSFDQEDFIGVCLKNIRCCCFFFLVITLLAFTFWSLYKIANADKYVESYHEYSEWTEGEMPLPQIAFHGLDSAYQMEVSSQVIKAGNWSSKTSTPVQLTLCDIPQRGHMIHSAKCLPLDLLVGGTYGDPAFHYTRADIYVPPNSASEGYVSILFKSRLSKSATIVDSRLHTFESDHRTVVEMFFKRIVAIEGESFGIANTRDETEAFLKKSEYLLYHNEYSRLNLPWARDDGFLNVMTFYFRAALVEQRDFYEPYTFIMFMQTAGGMWTSLAVIVSLSLAGCLWLLDWYRRISYFGIETALLRESSQRRTAVRCSTNPIGLREAALQEL